MSVDLYTTFFYEKRVSRHIEKHLMGMDLRLRDERPKRFALSRIMSWEDIKDILGV